MRSVAIGILTAVALFSAVAEADEDPRRAQAEALFKEGIALHDANREEDALAKFQQAYAVYPTPNILFALATSEQALGRSLPALKHYREAMKSPTLHPNNQQRGRDFVKTLEAKVCRLDVKADDGAVVIDGKPAAVGEPADVEAGDHVIEATSPQGRKAHATVACPKGQLITHRVTFAAGPVTEPPREEPASGGVLTTRNVVGGGAAVLAVAAGVVGVVFLTSSNGKASDANALDTPGTVRTPSVVAQHNGLVDDAESARTASYVTFGIAGALALTSAAVFAFWPSKRGAHVGFGPTSLGLAGTF